jgi:hypothetical protein
MNGHPSGTDTDPRLEQMRIEAVRRMSASEKIRQVCELNELAMALHRAGLCKRYPHATASELKRLSVVERYGEDAARFLFGPPQP